MINPRILLTGYTGRLGPLILGDLLAAVPASDVACIVRPGSPAGEDATDRLKALGVEVRAADYDDPDSLATATAGIERLMLVSGSDLGKRTMQHRNVIGAAMRSGVGFIAYTSVLHADRSEISVAESHRSTEAMLADAGIPYALLRNGWYSENLTPLIPAALTQHELLGAAGNGRISSAERRDYAAAAAAVILSHDDDSAHIYECAGDAGYTLAEFAAEISQQAGAKVDYRDLSEAEYDAALRAAGFPALLASILSTSHTAVADGELFDDSGDLAKLIGRPTTPISRTIADALASSL